MEKLLTQKDEIDGKLQKQAMDSAGVVCITDRRGR